MTTWEYESKWLADLKVGDEVIMVWCGAPRLVTIDRATKLHVETSGLKFRRKGGMSVRMIGGRFQMSVGFIVSKESRPDLLERIQQ